MKFSEIFNEIKIVSQWETDQILKSFDILIDFDVNIVSEIKKLSEKINVRNDEISINVINKIEKLLEKYAHNKNNTAELIDKYFYAVSHLFKSTPGKVARGIEQLKKNMFWKQPEYLFKTGYTDLTDESAEEHYFSSRDNSQVSAKLKMIIPEVCDYILKELKKIKSDIKQPIAYMLKKRSVKIESTTYKGMRIVFTLEDEDTNMYLLSLVKTCIDKLVREKMDFLFDKTKINFVGKDTYELIRGTRNNGSSSIAHYSNATKQIYIRNHIQKNKLSEGELFEREVMNTVYHEFGHLVHLSIENKKVYSDWLAIYDRIIGDISSAGKKRFTEKTLFDEVKQSMPVKEVKFNKSGILAGTFTIFLKKKYGRKTDRIILENFCEILRLDRLKGIEGEKLTFPSWRDFDSDGFTDRITVRADEGTLSTPTVYARLNERELFAEIFCHVMMPNYAHFEINRELLQAFKDCIRGIHSRTFKESINEIR